MTDDGSPAAPSPAVRRLLLVVALVPFVTAAVRAISDDWFPIGDSALLYLRSVDVLTEHHPLLGSWSSASLELGIDVNNPGPLYADVVAPFAHLFSPGVGNVLGVTAVNVACLVGAVLTARRIGGWRFERWILVAGASLAWTLGSEVLFDIFQAHALLFPFLWTSVLLVGAMDRRRWVWPWLAVTLSLILQTHISYAYIVVLLGLLTVGVLLAEAERPRWSAVRLAVRSRTAAVSAGVIVLLWMQPLVEEFVGEGEGNLSRLLSNASGSDVTVGLRNAIKLVAAVFALPPWWTRWGFADTIEPAGRQEGPDGPVVVIPGLPGGATAVVSLVALMALIGLAWRRAHRTRDTTLRHLAVLALGSVVASVIAMSRLTVGLVGLAPHHTRWMFVLSLLVHVTLAWAAVDWLRQRLGDRVSDIGPLGVPLGGWVTGVLVVLVSVANVPMYTHQQGPLADTEAMPAMRRLFTQLDRVADLQPVRYRTDNIRVFEPYSSAVQLQLEDRGIEFRVVDESLLRQLGTSRRSDGAEPVEMAQYERWDVVGGRYDGCLLVRASALPADEDAAIEALGDSLAGDVVASGVDVRGVLSAGDANELDRAMAELVVAGDDAAARQVTFDGQLRYWIDRGWVVGDPAVLERVLADGPVVTEWLNSVIALVLTPGDACDR